MHRADRIDPISARIDGHGEGPTGSFGIAESELEQLLATGFLAYRAAVAASGLLRMVSRPDDMSNRRLGWTAFVIDASSAAFEARSVRRSRTLRTTSAAASEAISGALVAGIGARAMSPQAWINGTGWTLGSSLWRASGTAVTDLRWWVRAVGFSAQVLPYALRRIDSSGPIRRVANVLPDMTAFGIEGLLMVNSLRARSRRIDARADELAEQQLRLVLAQEETALRDEVLHATAQQAENVRVLLRSDRAAAIVLAEAEQIRLRRWLESNAQLLTEELPVDTTSDVADAEAAIRGATRTIEAAMRTLSSALALSKASHHPFRDRRVARALQTVVIARLLVGITLVLPVAPRSRQRAIAVVDLVATILLSVAEVADGRNDGGIGWLQGFLVSCAATAGTVDGDPALSAATGAAISLVRSLVPLADDRPTRRKIAASADEVVSHAASAALSRWLISTALTQARQLTQTSTALATRSAQVNLEASRLRSQAFVHDGAVQMLMWIGKDDLSDDQLETWLDREVERLKSLTRVDGDVHQSSIEDGIADLVDGFSRLGMTVSLDCELIPTHTPMLGATVVEIMNEALTNVFKHTTNRTAHCQARMVGGRLVVSVLDFETKGAQVIPGTGTGTATMASLATVIGADLTWTATPAGGTMVTLTTTLDEPGVHAYV